MPNYRRWYQPGGSYFFTVNTYRRRRIFKSRLARQLLGDAIRKIRDELPFQSIALVLLHDHLHAMWSLPPGDDDFSLRWKRIKSEFTETWLARGGTELPVTPSQGRRGHRGVWQIRFWEHLIRDESDFENHFDYTHYNPVKHRYCRRVRDWPFSTFHKYVKCGVYPADWGRTEPPNISDMDLE